ncbi:MAG: Type IV secretion system protein VirB11 [Tenericutes bacterium ADurb.Bin087]|nr:MAG: Type IV secretion system protein VirB11 [Tenericutes bacterium ADurb.Bin087]
MEKVIKVIEESFLAPLLGDKSITDISYNGAHLFYFSNDVGRKLYGAIDHKIVASFLRNVANFANERFSYADTFLDISIGKYRLSAMHYACSRFEFEESLSFALRINHNFLASNPHYLNADVVEVLKHVMRQNRSIIISGTTGVGKTTLQKYLLMLLPANTRVLVIDNVLELSEVTSLNRELDLTLWQSLTNNEDEIKGFVQKALRFHPDYLIIAESRGGEMKEILQGAISGHPNIVTLHADSAMLAYERVIYLANHKDRNSLLQAFPYVIHLAKTYKKDGKIYRYIEKITEYNSDTCEAEVLYHEVLP